MRGCGSWLDKGFVDLSKRTVVLESVWLPDADDEKRRVVGCDGLALIREICSNSRISWPVPNVGGRSGNVTNDRSRFPFLQLRKMSGLFVIHSLLPDDRKRPSARSHAETISAIIGKDNLFGFQSILKRAARGIGMLRIFRLVG